jgi:hypothetical protein
MLPASDLQRLSELNDQIKILVAHETDLNEELRITLSSLNRHVVRMRAGSSQDSASATAPEFIEHAINVITFVAGVLAHNWIARADDAAAQRVLQRRRKRKFATPAQIRHVARYRVNVEWPARIGPKDEPYAESRGPNGWTVTWIKNGEKFEAEGDNDLNGVTLRRESWVPEMR